MTSITVSCHFRLYAAVLLFGLSSGLTPAQARDDFLTRFSDEELHVIQSDLASSYNNQSLLEDHVVNQYLRDLVAEIDTDDRIFVIANPNKIPNAFANWGGIISVNAGLIPFAQNENAFLGVIAHEIAHIELEHFNRIGDQLKFVNVLASGVLLVNLFTGGKAGGKALAGAVGIGKGQEFALRRRYEREADHKAARYLNQANLPLTDYASLVTRLSAGNSLPEYASTHPFGDERVAIMKSIERSQPAISATEPSLAFWLVREHALLVIGEQGKFAPPANLQTIVQAYRSLLRNAGDTAAAWQSLQPHREHWMVALLLAKSTLTQPNEAIELIETAAQRWPDKLPLHVRMLELFTSTNQPKEARFYLSLLPDEIRATKAIAGTEARMAREQGNELRFRVAVAYTQYYSGKLVAALQQIAQARKLAAATEITATAGRLQLLEKKIRQLKLLLKDE